MIKIHVSNRLDASAIERLESSPGPGFTGALNGFRLGLMALMLMIPVKSGAAPMGSSSESSPVKIGLLVPEDGPLALEGQAVRQAAQMAVETANAGGGYHGRPFQLVVRSTAGPWRSGSSDIVELVYEHEVLAILGALDSRTTHLAEQIATKGHLVLITPWVSDPTLSRINIPWFFRLVPDDRQQAQALATEIFTRRHLERVATIAVESFDAQLAATAFDHAAVGMGQVLVRQFLFDETESDFTALAKQIKASDPDGLVLYGPSLLLARLVHLLRSQDVTCPLFGPLALTDTRFMEETGPALGTLVVAVPSSWEAPAWQDFQQAFRDHYGYASPPVAAYAYDGMTLILSAIRRVGPDRYKIRDALAAVNDIQGITGPIRFDGSGNRKGFVRLVILSK